MSLGSILSKITGAVAGDPGVIEHDDFVSVVKEKSCAVVDVREPHEYAAGHVPGAVNMPLSSFDPGKLPKGECVLICQAGGRSAKALAAARNAGRDDVRHYAGGTGGWRAKGERVE